MSVLQSIENKLDEALVKNAPFQLPEGLRKWIADYAWVFTLIGFILGTLSALFFLPLLGFVSVVGTTANAGRFALFSWIAFIVLVGYVVLLGLATPKLKDKQKRGWDLVFIGALALLVYNFVAWLQLPSVGSFFGLLWNVAWAVLGLYIIFQVRSYFVTVSKTAASKKPTAAKSKKKQR